MYQQAAMCLGRDESKFLTGLYFFPVAREACARLLDDPATRSSMVSLEPPKPDSFNRNLVNFSPASSAVERSFISDQRTKQNTATRGKVTAASRCSHHLSPLCKHTSWLGLHTQQRTSKSLGQLNQEWQQPLPLILLGLAVQNGRPIWKQRIK